LLALLAGLAGPVAASHDWLGMDLCRTYPERMPPPLDPALLPEPDGAGARLLLRHCGQCHHPPGPGQHTAAQWAEVVPRMGLLMQATARFGAGLRPVAVPGSDEQQRLLGYLQRHALRPLVDPAAAPPAYRALCGDCHPAPDPAAYREADWPALLARMGAHRRVMGRAPAEPQDQTRVQAFLGVAPQAQVAGAAGPAQGPAGPGYGRWLALGPLLVLVLLGLVRWGRRSGRA
jgi:hypothetical protein